MNKIMISENRGRDCYRTEMTKYEVPAKIIDRIKTYKSPGLDGNHLRILKYPTKM